MKKTIKTSLSLLGLIALLMVTPSCSNDDDNIPEVHELVGTWRRTDFSEDLEERYKFYEDNTGTYYLHDGSSYSSIIFNWEALDNALSITHGNNNNPLMIFYEINELGQLVFFGDANLTYNKIP